jgi:hypothetical protein
MSGSRLRCSMTTNTPSSSNPTAVATTIAGETQPKFRPCTSANTSKVTALVAVSAPGRSNPRSLIPRLIRLDQTEGQNERRPRERDVDEEHRLPAECAREDAAQQDADDQASCSSAHQTPSARLRSRPSGNVVLMIAKVLGKAPPRPCTAHLRTTNPIESTFATVRLRQKNP